MRVIVNLILLSVVWSLSRRLSIPRLKGAVVRAGSYFEVRGLIVVDTGLNR